jgi:hypothetical protein
MNGNKSNGRDVTTGRFTHGNSGRQRGSRNRLAERFLDDLQKQWRKSGREVLEKVVATDPVQFLKVVSHVLPREIDATMAVNVNLFAEIENFNEAYRYALRHIGSEIEHKPEPKLIEHGNGHDDSHADD